MTCVAALQGRRGLTLGIRGRTWGRGSSRRSEPSTEWEAGSHIQIGDLRARARTTGSRKYGEAAANFRDRWDRRP